MKTPMKFALLGVTATAIAMAITVPVVAKGKMSERFDQMDTNSDGFIDAAEIAAFKEAHFKEADKNGDGALDADELAAQHEERAKKRKAKAAERQAKLIERLDTNKDGKLQQAEMSGGRMDRMMKHADADGDGRISKDEASKMRRGGKNRKPAKE